MKYQNLIEILELTHSNFQKMQGIIFKFEVAIYLQILNNLNVLLYLFNRLFDKKYIIHLVW